MTNYHFNNQRKLIPLWRDANCLPLLIEEAVGRFARYDKCSVGADLCRQAMGTGCYHLADSLGLAYKQFPLTSGLY